MSYGSRHTNLSQRARHRRAVRLHQGYERGLRQNITDLVNQTENTELLAKIQRELAASVSKETQPGPTR